MSGTADLAIHITLKDAASAGMDALSRKAGNLGSTMGSVLKVGAIAAGAGIAAAAGALIAFGKEAAEEQVGIARLQTALGNLGAAHRGNAAEVENLISARMKLGYSDDQLRDSLSLLVAQTDDYDDACRRQAVAMDLARGAGMDLQTASRLLGKATDENTKVLQRYGVTIKEGAGVTEMLAEVQKKFGGQSAAYAETAAGKWAILTNRIDDVKETIGAALLPTATKAFAAIGTYLEKHQADIGRISQDIANWIGKAIPSAFETLKPYLLMAADGFRQIGKAAIDFGSWVINNQGALIAALTGIGIALAWANPVLALGAGIAAIAVGMGAMGTAAESTDPKVKEAAKKVLEMKVAAGEAALKVDTLGLFAIPKLGGALRDFIGSDLGGEFSGLIHDGVVEVDKFKEQINLLDWQLGVLNGDPAVTGAIEQIKEIGWRAFASIKPVWEFVESIADLTPASQSVNTSVAQMQIDALMRKALEAYNAIWNLISGMVSLNQTSVNLADVQRIKTLPEIYAEAERNAPLENEIARFNNLKSSLTAVQKAHEDVLPPILNTGGGAAAAAEKISEEAQSLLDLQSALIAVGMTGEQFIQWQIECQSAAAFLTQAAEKLDVSFENLLDAFLRSGLQASEFGRRISELTALEDTKDQAEDAMRAVDGLYDAFSRLYEKPTKEGAEQNLALSKLQQERAVLIAGGADSDSKKVKAIDEQIDQLQAEIAVRRANEEVMKDELDVRNASLLLDKDQAAMSQALIDKMGPLSVTAADFNTQLFFATIGLADLNTWFENLTGSTSKAAAALERYVNSTQEQKDTLARATPGELLALWNATPSFQHGGVMPYTGMAHLEKGEQVIPASRQLTAGNTSHTFYGPVTIQVSGGANIFEEIQRQLR